MDVDLIEKEWRNLKTTSKDTDYAKRLKAVWVYMRTGLIFL